MHIGLIREEKKPYDKRVAFSPKQCFDLLQNHPELQITVQPSPHRCFPDAEYLQAGCALSEDLSACEILLGIKEVPKESLIANKTYCFFSHTIKKQDYNRAMLQEILKKQIRLIDYECLTWENGSRIIGFGRFAGIVGTHNGLLAYGEKTKQYHLEPAWKCFDYKEMLSHYNHFELPPIKIALCGDGRVAHGALELLNFLKIREVTSRAYIHEQFNEPVYVHLRTDQLYEHKNNSPFDKSYFYRNPEEYFSTFNQFYPVTDILLNAIFWNESIPRHFSLEDMAKPEFNIKVIADISCDIDGSVPATVRATTIEDPVYGWDQFLQKETKPYLPKTVDLMTVSNLPCELSRDASEEFGALFIRHILPSVLGPDPEKILDRATVTEAGKLHGKFSYLQDFADGKE
ncbi:MAG: alanine dehydrogenase [Bacteroidetes bacterium]|nr:MAG: alanine dehydrogenase [Bacteroidota bacterium]